MPRAAALAASVGARTPLLRRAGSPAAAAAAAVAPMASSPALVRHLGFHIKIKHTPGSPKPAAAAPPPKAARERLPPPPPSNEAIDAPLIRLLGADGANLGVMPPADALVRAREASLDLVMSVPHATPPVCRLVELRAFYRGLRDAQVERRKSERVRQAKEMRYSARIDGVCGTTRALHAGGWTRSAGTTTLSFCWGIRFVCIWNAASTPLYELWDASSPAAADHDLDVKSAKVIEFLREGRPVRVAVQFTMSVWSKEEPARREVFSKIVQRVRRVVCVGRWCSTEGRAAHAANLYAIANTPSCR